MLGPGFCVRSARPEKGTATGLGIGAFGLVLATATMEPRTVIQFNSILCPASIRLTRKRPSPDKKPASGLDQLPWPASRPPASDPNMAVRQFPEAWNGQDNPESGTQQCHDHLGGPKQHTTSRGRFVNEEKKMGDANINRISFERAQNGVGGILRRRSASRWPAEARDTGPGVQVSWEDHGWKRNQLVEPPSPGCDWVPSAGHPPRFAAPTALVTSRTPRRVGRSPSSPAPAFWQRPSVQGMTAGRLAWMGFLVAPSTPEPGPDRKVDRGLAIHGQSR